MSEKVRVIVANFFAGFVEQCKKLTTEKQRYGLVCTAGLLLIAVVIMITGSPTSQQAAYVQSEREAHSADQQRYQEFIPAPSSGIRDPFSAPDSFTVKQKQEKESANLPAIASSEKLPATPPLQEKAPTNDELPVLIGTIRDSKTQLAILLYKGTSRSYRVGQKVGVYQLEEISDKSAVIRGGRENGSYK